ncbi:MAG: hypothetical protein KDE55_05580 [Novosphingobium sp.]|nr:hypothetical protein [Novosphingobium sp.]
MQGWFVKLGIYRTRRSGVGECARVHWTAGDGAPYLEREIYEILELQPSFESLPTLEEYQRRHEPTQMEV